MEKFKNENKEMRMEMQYNELLGKFLEDSLGDYHPEKIDKETILKNLESPEFLKDFFEDKDFEFSESLPIENKGGTTLFISSGVQVLDHVIHQEKEIPQDNIFIAQPVIRTQFINKISEGVSTSFINISTEIVNKGVEDHFSAIGNWLDFLQKLGFEKDSLKFLAKSSNEKWGDKKFINRVIKIYYNGIEIGDACYICNMPQNTRENISISDIGFGIERLKWLVSEGKYSHQLAPKLENIAEINPSVLDYVRSLVLLAGSGVYPSNKEWGYRFRLFSKLLVRNNIKNGANISKLIDYFYNDWSRWTKFNVSREDVKESILKENERNFNRELIDRLKNKYLDVDIDINQSTENVIKALRGTSVDRNSLEKILKELS